MYKKCQVRQALLIEALRILNETMPFPVMLKQLLFAIQQAKGFDAVAIRLQSGEDFPYFAHSGFSDSFIASENSLITRDKDGIICRDKNGKISLGCTCGLVVSGKTDPKNPLFTPGGSAWSNESRNLLNIPADQDPRLQARNTCVYKGYNSIALIPIRANKEIVGLLQLNSLKTDYLNLEMIEYFENLCMLISVGMMRNQALDAHKEADDRYRAIVENSLIGIWYLDAQGRTSYVNQQMLKILGRTSDSVLLHSPLEFILEADRPVFLERLRNRKEGIKEIYVLRFKKKDTGAIIFTQLFATPRYDDNGHYIGAFAMVSDISETYKAQMALDESSRCYEALIEQASDGILVLDLAGNIVTANEAFAKMHGYELEEVKQLGLKKINICTPSHEFDANIGRIKEGEVWSGEVVHKKKNGGDLHLLVTCNLIKAGEKRLLLAMHHDLTKQKHAENALLQSAKMVSLGEMAAGIIHEINNPLAIIQAHAERLAKQLTTNQFDKKNGIERLEKILTTSSRISQIIKGIKSFARNSENDPFASVPLNTVMDDVIGFCAERFKIDAVKLELDTVPELDLECRIVQIEQVLVNLFNNAYDAVSVLKEKWVRVGFVNTGERIQISITDSGNGIPSHIAEKLMEPFFTTKEVGKGTGLGLSISKRIIEDHGGKFWLDSSSPNTRFLIDLPLKQASCIK